MPVIDDLGKEASFVLHERRFVILMRHTTCLAMLCSWKKMPPATLPGGKLLKSLTNRLLTLVSG